MTAILFLGVFFGLISSGIAYDRGRSAVFWFVFGFLFHILGLIVIFLPRVARAGVNRECSNCKEIIKDKARVCRYCGSSAS
ncbi:MAG: hypothetical protein HQM16_10155 [Deltaproteobacteria bacterium]|nr:hypothetical protein [Deltaproteobacteria bacterium]